jgi:two-component system sensor histidine kinase YesM
VKLLAVCFALIFAPLGLLTLVMYGRIGDMMEEQMKRSASQSFQQASSYLAFKLSHMIDISDTIYFNTGVQDILVKYRAGDSFDIFEQTKDMRELDTFLNSFLNGDIYRVTLYAPRGFLYSGQGVFIGDYDEFMGTEAYQALMGSRDKALWIPNERLPYLHAISDPVSVVSLYRKVRNQSQISEITGVIRLSVRQDSIDFIVSNADISKQGVVFITNKNGEVVSRSSQVNLERFGDGLGWDGVGDGMGSDERWFDTEAGSGRYLVMARAISGTDWVMTCAIPYKELTSQRWGLLLMTLALAGSVGAATYLVSFLMSRSVISRMHDLMERMRNVYSGERPEVEGEGDVRTGRVHGELDQMIAAFNFMVRRIDRLVEEKYQQGKEIKSAELRALQAQINPHFLYNTLDLINWKASEYGAREVVDIVRALARFYRLSLGKGSDMVGLRDELDHVRAYVRIQNQRFEQGIRLEVEVDESFEGYKVPKIVLQPLVENAILHGIMCKGEGKSGWVRVSAGREGGQLVISVADNGVGMDEEKARQVMSGEGDLGRRYGVYNINRMIKLCYGVEYGLRYRFPAEGGTVAMLNLPLEG